MSVPAGSAAHQVDLLTKQMRSLQSAMIKSNALGDGKAFAKQAKQYQTLTEKVQELGPAATAQTDAVKASMTGATTKTQGFASAMKAVGPQVMAVATAVLAAVAAVAALVIGFYKLVSSVAKLTEQRRQLQVTFAALGGGEAAGKATLAMLDKLAQQLPFTTTEMSKWVQAMQDAGIRDLPTLTSATKAAAASAAILGDSSGAAGQKIADLHVQLADAIRTKQGIGDLTTMLRGTGTSIEDVAGVLKISTAQLKAMAASGKNLSVIGKAIDEALIRKGGAAIQNMTATWDVMVKRAKESFFGLFDGVATTPGFKSFIGAMQHLLSLFSQSTAAGQTMKAGVTKSFDGIFAVASKVITWIHVSILKLATAGVRWYISMHPTLRTLVLIGAQAKKLGALKYIFEGIAVVVGLVAKGVWNLVRPFVYAIGIVVALATGVLAVVGIVAKAGAKVWDTFTGWKDKALEAAANFIKGLVDGITKGTKDVLSAVTNLGNSTVSTFNDTLVIKSPSQRMRASGLNAGKGAALGIVDSHKEVEAAASSMGESAVDGFSGGSADAGASSSGGSGGGLTINGGITITIAAANAAATALELTEEAVAAMLERLAATRGLVPAS